VPWLVLAGHCIESLAYDFGQQLGVTPELLAEVQQLSPAAMQDLLRGRDEASRDQQRFDWRKSGVAADEARARLKNLRLLTNLFSFLDSTAGQQLAAAGYAVVLLLRELAVAEQLVCLVLPDPANIELHGEPLQQGALVLQLQKVGQLLRALPCGWACNKPSCSSTSNFAGASELLAKRKYCSRCRTAAYCSQECLVAHFRQHKGDCKALAAAAASAGGDDAA
jgi:hypothetical protein